VCPPVQTDWQFRNAANVMDLSVQIPTGLSFSVFLRVAPGFLGAFLVLFALGRLENVPIGDAVTMVATWGLLLGLFFLMTRYGIWCFYEGRWFWPAGLARHLVARLQDKLDKDFEQSRKLKQRIDEFLRRGDLSAKELAELDETYSRYSELWFSIRQYPEDPKLIWKVTDKLEVGRRKVTCPTRFGNIVAEFESYPVIRYGIDPVFFWYRLRFLLPKEAYEAIDNSAAIVDSLVFTSVAFAMFTPLYMLVSSFACTVSIAVALASLLLSYCAYRLSLLGLRSYGEHFKALFDVYRQELFSRMQNLMSRPSNVKEEFAFWERIQGYLMYSKPLPNTKGASKSA